MILCLFGTLTPLVRRALSFVAGACILMGVASGSEGDGKAGLTADAIYAKATEYTNFPEVDSIQALSARRQMGPVFDSFMVKYVATNDSGLLWVSRSPNVSLQATLRCSEPRDFDVSLDMQGRFVIAISHRDTSEIVRLKPEAVSGALQPRCDITGLSTEAPAVPLRRALELAAPSVAYAVTSCYAFLLDVYDNEKEASRTLWVIVGAGRPEFGGRFEDDCSVKDPENAITALDAFTGELCFVYYYRY